MRMRTTVTRWTCLIYVNSLVPTQEHTVSVYTKEPWTMKLLHDLFSTDYGLMSITGITFMLGMGVFFIRLFKRKMREDAASAGL